ncbi:MAG: hypothetical protein CL862_00430 [Cyanobium sp. NAT70]|nr:hypothetical protein [Cyanobium sp. NAT70]
MVTSPAPMGAPVTTLVGFEGAGVVGAGGAAGVAGAEGAAGLAAAGGAAGADAPAPMGAPVTTLGPGAVGRGGGVAMTPGARAVDTDVGAAGRAAVVGGWGRTTF